MAAPSSSPGRSAPSCRPAIRVGAADQKIPAAHRPPDPRHASDPQPPAHGRTLGPIVDSTAVANRLVSIFEFTMRGRSRVAIMEWTLAASPKSRREAHYGNRVVSCFAERPATVSDMFDATTAAKPDGEALVSGEQRWSWREVESEVAACAAALAERGIAAGDRVALLVGNRAEFVVALFAVLRLGAIAVPLSTRYQTPGDRVRPQRLRRLAACPRRRPRAAASGAGPGSRRPQARGRRGRCEYGTPMKPNPGEP